MRVPIVLLLFACLLLTPSSAQAATEPGEKRANTSSFGYPIGLPNRVPGDGFYIRDGFAVENTWYKPRWWHTGEDWYTTDGSTENALVYAVADGEVVYAGANYPGRVVIIQHEKQLFSMYGHLKTELKVRLGQKVKRGDLLGVVRAGWKQAPAHLHFEIRTFLTTRVVNGAKPRYGYPCGVNCPPGPGYWPQAAPEHPAKLGWRNPSMVVNNRLAPASEVVIVAKPVSSTLTLWSEPKLHGAVPQVVAEITAKAGQRFSLAQVQTMRADGAGTSAEAYGVWYKVQLGNERTGWVQALVPSDEEVSSDGRATAVRFNLVPVPSDESSKAIKR